jgi:hypothetical protein
MKLSGGEQESYRWEMCADTTRPTVSIIEPPKQDDAKSNTPFGFGRVLRVDLIEVEPLVFEGEGAMGIMQMGFLRMAAGGNIQGGSEHRLHDHQPEETE